MLDHEKAVLGACLVNSANIGPVVESLRADHFTAKARPIFLAMKAMLEVGQPVELIGLKNQLVKTASLESVGGISVVAGLSDGLPAIPREVLDGWVGAVKEAGRRRRVASEIARLGTVASDEGLDSASLLEQIQAVAFDLDAGTVGGTSFGPVDLMREASRLVDEICDSEGGIIGVPSGLPALDEMTGGFTPGQYVAVGSRPSVGKSSLSLQIASHAADMGHVVAFFSIEMEAGELALVRACSEAEVSRFAIQNSRGNHRDMHKITAAIGRQSGTPMFVEKLTSPSLGPIRSRAARIRAERGLGLIVIDYLQLMRSESKRSNRNEEITEISRGLKVMAGQLGCPVIVCAQLNREAAEKGNTKPRLSQFRDSGSIEADADVAILLHRTNENADRSLPVDVDLIVDKNRTGACGVVATSFLGKWQKFVPREAFTE